jgi:PASTA domain-containing protein
MSSRLLTVCALLAVAGAVGCGGGDGGDRGGPVRTSPRGVTVGTVTMPDVIGLTVKQAERKLCAAGFTIGSVKVVKRTGQLRNLGSAEAAVRVVSTVPTAGSVVNQVLVPTGAGSTVNSSQAAAAPVILRIREPSNVAAAFRVGVCRGP